MSKKEFLDILYNQLSGQMPEGSVAAHVQYYRNYIEDEQQKGRTETDILNDLGLPGRFLIQKSVPAIRRTEAHILLHTMKQIPIITNMTAPIPPGGMLRSTALSWIFPHGTVKLLSF